MFIFYSILLFSFLIFVHEFGHFITAKLSGVQVNEFAIFMGPAIFKKQVGETLYSIRLIPIGGYCAMEGEDEETDNPRAFCRAKWWKRLIILVAGAAMNFIIGVLLLFIVFSNYKSLDTTVFLKAEEGCTVFREDGIHLGDRLLKIDGERVYVSNDFSMLMTLSDGSPDIVVERDGEKLYFKDYQMETHLFGNEKEERYGFQFGYIKNTFANRLRYTWDYSINMSRAVRLSFRMIFTGQAGIQDMSGPVGIVQVMSDSASQADTKLGAYLTILLFGGFLAINLAVMNLLPIPALDGGRVVGLLLTTAIEKITRKKVSPKIEGYIHGIGMILLLALMAVIMFKDVIFLFK